MSNEIPTSVLLTQVYGELGKGLGWSLERTKFHTELSMVSDISDNIILEQYMIELEEFVKQNPTTLLTDLNERKNLIQIEYVRLNTFLLRILRQRTNIHSIEGACHKDIQNTILHTGIVYILEDGKVCNNDAVKQINNLILTHDVVKDICRKVLISYAKVIMITDTLIKCLMMAKMTGQIE
jgi:hypothetical protein